MKKGSNYDDFSYDDWGLDESPASNHRGTVKSNTGARSFFDDDDDYHSVGFKNKSYSSSSANKKWNSYFSFSKETQPTDSCIKWKFGYSNYSLDNYIKIFKLAKAEEAKAIIESLNMDYIIKDIFYLYYEDEREFIINETTTDWYDQLCEFDSYLIRKFTKENKSFSHIITAFLLEHVFSSMFNNNTQPPKDANEFKQGMGNAIKGKNFNNMLQSAFGKAQEKNSTLEDVKKELGIGAEEGDRDEDILTFMENDIFLSLNNIKKFFKDMFSKKGVITTEKFAKVTTEDINDAEHFIDFVDIESFATPFPNFEVFVKKGAKIKFDIYVDVSGSMEYDDIKLGKNVVSRASMAKVLAVKMASFGILGNVYTFSTSVKAGYKHPRDIRFNGGGTDPDCCVKHRETLSSAKKRDKYLILTDGDCENHIYDKNCVMLSIAGMSTVQRNCEAAIAGTYRSWHTNDKSGAVLLNYIKNKQYIFYDGKKVLSLENVLKEKNNAKK